MKTIAAGITKQTLPIEPPKIINQINPAKIFNNVCPDIKFANNRIDKLKTRATYEIISIIIRNGAMANGAPLGKKRAKKLNPCLRIPT